MDFNLNLLDQVKGLGNWLSWLWTDCSWELMSILVLLILIWSVGLIPRVRSHWLVLSGMLAGFIYFMLMIKNSDIPPKSVDPTHIRCMLSIIMAGLPCGIYMRFLRRRNDRGEWETQIIPKDKNGT